MADLWNEILSSLEPELMDFAEYLAGFVPEGSFLRTRFGGRALGVGKALLESQAKGAKNRFLGALIEKTSDLLDFTGVHLGHKGKKAPSGGDPARVLKGLTDRILKAEDPNAEAAKILAAFKVALKLQKKMERAKKAANPAKEEAEAVDWAHVQARLIAVMTTTTVAVNMAAEKAAVPVGKFAGWLESQRGGKR